MTMSDKIYLFSLSATTGRWGRVKQKSKPEKKESLVLPGFAFSLVLIFHSSPTTESLEQGMVIGTKKLQVEIFEKNFNYL